MSGRWAKWVVPALIAAGFLLLAGFLPVLGPKLYLSPDETAIAAAAQAYLKTGMMRLGPAGPFAWVHPRSVVTQGAYLMPVGFLGMPFVAALVAGLFGVAAMLWITPFAVVSALYPLWRLTSRWRNASRWATLLLWCSFPSVILYADRGLFANLPVICLAIWSVWLVYGARRPRDYIVAALLSGLALTIRPSEVVWFAAWLIAAFLLRDEKSPKLGPVQICGIAMAGLIFPAIVGYIAFKTYGQPFVIGYLLRDVGSSAASPLVTLPPQTVTVTSVWPFGFHPHNMLFNLQQYLLMFLAPWTALCALAIGLAWPSKRGRIIVLTGLLTSIVLIMLYGQTVYQDHIGSNIVSLGNSFLRYTLPLAPFVALAGGWACERLYALRPRRAMAVILTMAIWTLASFGIWTATVRDNEGLVADRVELAHYAELRDETVKDIPPDSIVLSDRSDKIFFPQFSAVSPMPTLADAAALRQVTPDVYYFGSIIQDNALKQWSAVGLVPDPVFQSQGQALYHLRSTVPTSS